MNLIHAVILYEAEIEECTLDWFSVIQEIEGQFCQINGDNVLF